MESELDKTKSRLDEIKVTDIIQDNSIKIAQLNTSIQAKSIKKDCLVK